MAGNIFSTLGDLAKAVDTLRDQLEPIRRLAPSPGQRPGRPKGRSTPVRKARPRKAAKKTSRRASARVSAKVHALRKQQGRYMGLVKKLTAAQKAQVKKVKQAKGYGPALKLAAHLGK